MNDKLPPMPMPMAEKRELSLSDLSMRNSTLAEDLLQHTRARNYLWRIANGEESPPALVLKPLPRMPGMPGDGPDGDSHDVSRYATIDMDKLPQDAIEGIVYTIIGHEEQLAIETWQNIAKNATLACNLIEKMRAQANQKAAPPPQPSADPYPNEDGGDEEEYPPTIPMLPTNLMDPDQEVPRGWPGQ